MTIVEQMKILIVSATHKEIAACKAFLGISDEQDDRSVQWGKHTINFLVTGLGMLATTYAMSKQDLRSFRYIINVGVAGAFEKELALGQVVRVVSEEVEGFGISSPHGFRPIFALGLMDNDKLHFQEGKLLAPDVLQANTSLENLTKVAGLTSDTVHGEQKEIDMIQERHTAEIETMESAAFFYVCKREGCEQWIALRGISNYVEPRNRKAWKLNEAIEQVNKTVINLLTELTNKHRDE